MNTTIKTIFEALAHKTKCRYIYNNLLGVHSLITTQEHMALQYCEESESWYKYTHKSKFVVESVFKLDLNNPNSIETIERTIKEHINHKPTHHNRAEPQ